MLSVKTHLKFLTNSPTLIQLASKDIGKNKSFVRKREPLLWFTNIKETERD